MSKIYSKKYKCPICSRSHTIEVTDDVGCFLDGVPYQTMESMMKMVALCENCGVLYTTSKFDANVDEQTAWRSERSANTQKLWELPCVLKICPS